MRCVCPILFPSIWYLPILRLYCSNQVYDILRIWSSNSCIEYYNNWGQLGLRTNIYLLRISIFGTWRWLKAHWALMCCDMRRALGETKPDFVYLTFTWSIERASHIFTWVRRAHTMLLNMLLLPSLSSMLCLSTSPNPSDTLSPPAPPWSAPPWWCRGASSPLAQPAPSWTQSLPIYRYWPLTSQQLYASATTSS